MKTSFFFAYVIDEKILLLVLTKSFCCVVVSIQEHRRTLGLGWSQWALNHYIYEGKERR